jgi:prepilin-type N-terminal cleavage/methylation domain-containing protein
MKKSGFTLLELSIVLAIIGLLAGSVIAGKELMKAAQIRQQITQLQNYQTAFMTFKTKYGCYAGDCPNGDQLFGLDPADNGDGNGLVEFKNRINGTPIGYDQTIDENGFPNNYWNAWPLWNHPSSNEPKYALIQLSEAYLIEDAFNENWPDGINIAPGHAMVATKYNRTKGFFIGSHHNLFGRQNIEPNWTLYQRTPGNYIMMVVGNDYKGSYIALTSLANTSSNGKMDSIFTQMDAKAIDTKMDDGLPLTGNFLGLGPHFSQWNGSHALHGTETCMDNTTQDYRINKSKESCLAAYRIN